MIAYDPGRFGLHLIFRLHGSVFPKASWWAFPATLASAVLFKLKEYVEYTGEDESGGSGSSVITSISVFITILGFMVVFRSNQAWSRYWEGADLVLQARGSWVSATSSLIAFCSRQPKDAEGVRDFRNKLVRLMSLLFATSLRTLADESFEMLDLQGLDTAVLKRMDRSLREEVNIEMIVYWIQRTVVLGVDAGVLNIAPPLLSRVFNELADGVVRISSSRKIRLLQFPFHYAQMFSLLLFLYTIGAPVACAYAMRTWYGAASATFINVFVLWCINYLALEIERPFGKRANDLPLEEFMQGMNKILVMLLQEGADGPPGFNFDACVTLTRDAELEEEEVGPSCTRAGRMLLSIRRSLMPSSTPRRSRPSFGDSHTMSGTSSIATHRRPSGTDGGHSRPSAVNDWSPPPADGEVLGAKGFGVGDEPTGGAPSPSPPPSPPSPPPIAMSQPTSSTESPREESPQERESRRHALMLQAQIMQQQQHELMQKQRDQQHVQLAPPGREDGAWFAALRSPTPWPVWRARSGSDTLPGAPIDDLPGVERAPYPHGPSPSCERS